MTRPAARERLPAPRRTQRRYFGLFAALLSSGCASPPLAPCVQRAEPGLHSGFLVEWTAGRPSHQLDELCGSSGGESTLRFEVALLRGTGRVHVGAALRRELEPRLIEQFALDGWTLSCDRNFAIVLNAQKSRCQVDQVIEVVGDYLSQRQADDRVVIMMGLWAAPAI